LPTVYETEKKDPSKKRKRSLLGSTQLEVRLLREQRGKVRFAQGLHQKAQQRHQTRLWGRQTISDHVSLGMPSFPDFSQLIFSMENDRLRAMASLEESVAATSSSSGVPVFRSSTWT